MNKNSTLSRREFMTGVSAAGLFTMLPALKSGEVRHISEYKDEYIKALIKVLDEQASHDRYSLSSKQIDNLVYAFGRINPTNHQEMAFVAACSMNFQALNHIVDEYVRRRDGKKSVLPDHPVLAIEKWAQPDTKRILIFTEQFEAVIGELTSRPGRELFYKALRHELNEDSFYSLLNKRYRQGLSRDEFKAIYSAIMFYAPLRRPYACCSTMASRAARWAAKSNISNTLV